MPGGRPRKYTEAEVMEEKIDAYFAKCEAKDRPPTMAGLSLYLGFCDRASLLDYEGRGEEEFSRAIKKARSRIEVDRAERLLDKGAFTPGVIFDLKNNHGWKDKQEHDLSSPDGSMSPAVVKIVAATGEDVDSGD